MKTITRRLSELERRFAAHRGEQGRSLADVIRERRRRRLEAEGLPFKGWPTRGHVDAGDTHERLPK